MTSMGVVFLIIYGVFVRDVGKDGCMRGAGR